VNRDGSQATPRVRLRVVRPSGWPHFRQLHSHLVHGWLEIFSPFNVVNFVVTLITLSPGIAAYMLAEKLEQRAARRSLGAAQPNTSSSLAEVESLIQTYGAALEAAAATNAVVVDSNRLPAPKEKIKSALLVALQATQDPKMREQLKLGYVEISMFQPGVGSSPVACPIPSVPDPNSHEAILAAAQSVAEAGAEVERWSAIASEERDRLVEELKRAGFWRRAD
jgi:hypothetical protein